MKKIAILSLLAVVGLIFTSCCNSNNNQMAENGYTDKEAIANIFERKSVRTFQAQAVEQEKIDLILRAGMAAPSAMDRRPWEFVVLSERAAMDSLSAKLPYAKMLTQAPMAIIVCGDANASGNNWMIDCSAATQNILLAAEALGLGAVWTGVYPGEERVKMVSEALQLPENIIPLALIPMGYPEDDNKPKDKYNPDKIHRNVW